MNKLQMILLLIVLTVAGIIFTQRLPNPTIETYLTVIIALLVFPIILKVVTSI